MIQSITVLITISKKSSFWNFRNCILFLFQQINKWRLNKLYEFENYAVKSNYRNQKDKIKLGQKPQS